MCYMSISRDLLCGMCCRVREKRARRKQWLAAERKRIVNARQALRADSYRIILLHIKLM